MTVINIYYINIINVNKNDHLSIKLLKNDKTTSQNIIA